MNSVELPVVLLVHGTETVAFRSSHLEMKLS
jgi:hypothetical protein